MSAQGFRDKVGRVLREAGLIQARWVGFFDTLFNMKSAKLHPVIVDGLVPWTTPDTRGAEPMSRK